MGDDVEQPVGIEIKTWFPLATEITARFRESQLRLADMPIEVVIVAWLPEYILYGKPVILDIWHDNALSFASARDNHYHNPPDYLVVEPFDTTTRTLNLQQTNTNGYKFQGDESQFERAQMMVDSWGVDGRQYRPTLDYQIKLADLQSQFPYRLDTNFAKIDRIQHAGLEVFKKRVLSITKMGIPLSQWTHKNMSDDETLIKKLLE